MPIIANRIKRPVHESEPATVRRTDRRAGPPRSILLRLRVAVDRDLLNRSLAEGAAPTRTPMLALRAAQLTSKRNRKRLARTLRRSLDEVRRRPLTRTGVVIVRRAAVLEAEDALITMIERLISPEPVHVQGMAIAERIVSDAVWSPLYNPAEPASLRRLVLVATAAMDPGPESAHELPIAA
jgi:hypothetical protein